MDEQAKILIPMEDLLKIQKTLTYLVGYTFPHATLAKNAGNDAIKEIDLLVDKYLTSLKTQTTAPNIADAFEEEDESNPKSCDPDTQLTDTVGESGKWLAEELDKYEQHGGIVTNIIRGIFATLEWLDYTDTEPDSVNMYLNGVELYVADMTKQQFLNLLSAIGSPLEQDGF